MKAKYKAPQIIQVALQTRHLISVSETTQNVYTDDPLTTDQALVRGQNNKSMWDEKCDD